MQVVTSAVSILAIALASVGSAMAQQSPTTSIVSADGPAANWPTSQVSVAAGGKVVGGGVRANWRVGNLLTQSAPGAAPNTWVGSAKDHLVADPSTLTAFGVVLYDPNDEWEVVVQSGTSPASARPVATATIPAGFVLTGGGCTVNWRDTPGAAGNLLTSSIPVSNTTWECRSKEHGAASPAKITAYVIGIRPRTPGTPLPELSITRSISAVEAHPSAVAAIPAGFVMTGGGARAVPADPRGPGQLLTASFPEVRPGTVTTPGAWRAASKDHAYSSPGTVEAFAIGLRFKIVQQSAQAQAAGGAPQGGVTFAGSVLSTSPSSVSQCQLSCAATTACSGYTWRASGGEDRALIQPGGPVRDRTQIDPRLPPLVGNCTLYTGPLTAIVEPGTTACRKPCGAAYAELTPFPVTTRPGPIDISLLQPAPIGVAGQVQSGPPPIGFSRPQPAPIGVAGQVRPLPAPPPPVAPPAPPVRLTGYEIIAGQTGTAGPAGDIRVGAQCSPGRVSTGGGFSVNGNTAGLTRASAPNVSGLGHDTLLRNANVAFFSVDLTPFAICIDRPAGYAVAKVDGFINSRERSTIEASCPGKRLVGGGAGSNDTSVHLGSNAPRADGAAWSGYLRSDIPAFGNSSTFAEATCIDNSIAAETEVVTSGEAMIGSRSEVVLQVSCPAGKRALSGGVSSDNTVAVIVDSVPIFGGSAWGARVHNPTYPWDYSIVNARLRVICARVD